MQIEKNKPIPASKGGRPAKFDWVYDLEDGDCITFKSWEEFENCRYALRYRNIKHITRQRKTNHGGEFKIWITSA